MLILKLSFAPKLSFCNKPSAWSDARAKDQIFSDGLCHDAGEVKSRGGSTIWTFPWCPSDSRPHLLCICHILNHDSLPDKSTLNDRRPYKENPFRLVWPNTANWFLFFPQVLFMLMAAYCATLAVIQAGLRKQNVSRIGWKAPENMAKMRTGGCSKDSLS